MAKGLTSTPQTRETPKVGSAMSNTSPSPRSCALSLSNAKRWHPQEAFSSFPGLHQLFSPFHHHLALRKNEKKGNSRRSSRPGKQLFRLFLITPGRRQPLQSVVQIWLPLPTARGAQDDFQPPTPCSGSALGFAHRGQKMLLSLPGRWMPGNPTRALCLHVDVCVCVHGSPLLSPCPLPITFPSPSSFSNFPKPSRDRSDGTTEPHQAQVALLKAHYREEQSRMTHVGETLS